jgi:hypothetical protein
MIQRYGLPAYNDGEEYRVAVVGDGHDCVTCRRAAISCYSTSCCPTGRIFARRFPHEHDCSIIMVAAIRVTGRIVGLGVAPTLSAKAIRAAHLLAHVRGLARHIERAALARGRAWL